MANAFSNDPHCVILWRGEPADFDNPTAGKIYDHSGNANHMIGGVLDSNITDYQEGSGSMAHDGEGLDLAYVIDASLSSNFPLKSTYASAVQISTCGWFKLPNLPSSDYRTMWGKYDNNGNYRSLALSFIQNGADWHLIVYKGYNSGANWEETEHTLAMVADRWYHVGVTYDDSTGGVLIRVYDTNSESVTEVTDTHSQAISLTTANLYIASRQTYFGQNYTLDCILDELVFFNDILTADEIDAIRQGSYAPSGGYANAVMLGNVA